MPLDMDALYRRVEKMVTGVSDAASRHQLEEAQEFLRHADLGLLRQKLRQREQKTARKIPWLVAIPLHTLASTFPVHLPPSELSIVAADGSIISPDRHSSLAYFVLNIGYAVLTYGRVPGAILHAHARFCFEDDELYFDPSDKRIPIEDARLGILMSVEEMAGLLEAARLASSKPVVAVSDGSLIFWNLQNEDEDLQASFLARFLNALDGFRQEAIPVVSYISFPGSHDVVNSLRLILCDVESGGCHRCPQDTEGRKLCRFMGTIRDRHLFQGLLGRGERSDIFESESAILTRYQQHHIHFFYLNVGDELVRIEGPQWVMADRAMLELVHSAIYDQCQRSGQYPPYPPALIEAHEQAVISTADRQVIEEMVERALAAKGIFYIRSAKDRSKRNRGV